MVTDTFAMPKIKSQKPIFENKLQRYSASQKHGLPLQAEIIPFCPSTSLLRHSSIKKEDRNLQFHSTYHYTALFPLDQPGCQPSSQNKIISATNTTSAMSSEKTAAAPNNWAPGAQKIDATSIAKPFREEIREQIQKLKAEGIEAPLLVGLLANNDPAAKKYAEWTGRACKADGIRYELREIDDAIDVENALRDANDDPRVHGIIVYYPIFGQVESFSGESQDDYLRDTVSHKCDVEGLCHEYRSNLYRNKRYVDYPTNSKKCVLPCTALSVVKILESCPSCYDKSKPIGRHMEGQTVTIINRSEIVGRPLAAMLANDGADVYSIDIDSIYLFRGGRLYACDGETPESCVRKVRMAECDFLTCIRLRL